MILAYLANNLRWLCVIDGSKILLHGCVIITPLVQKVAILPVNSVLLQRINPNFLCEVDSKDVEVALI